MKKVILLVSFLALIGVSFIAINQVNAQSPRTNQVSADTKAVALPKATPMFDLAMIPSKHVYTFVCELKERKPALMSNVCATLGTHVRNIKWTKWDATGAKGTGIYSVKICKPDCASGTRKETNVKVELSGLIQLNGEYFLNFLEIKYNPEKSKNMPRWAANDLLWELDDFYRYMNK